MDIFMNDANSFDKAEEHYRAALKLDPNNYSDN